MSRVTSVSLSDERALQLDQLAAAMERPTTWVIEQAIARYLDEEAAEVVAIARELADYRAGIGKNIPHEEVFAGLEAKLRAMEANADNLA
ncbi:MAG: CopG family ribbon-helix-helix protein [Dehalococcoidia bacterium]